MPRASTKLSVGSARELGNRISAHVGELAKAADATLDSGFRREAMTLALVSLEELAKAQSLALQARLAAELGQDQFVAHGFYDHAEKGKVACEIVLGWTNIVTSFLKAAGLDYEEEEALIRTEFARISANYRS